jgi:coxsackievirus/adenovirus receptor
LGGALDNECDILTGQCKCRQHFTGRRCNTTESSYYCPNIDHYTYDAESSENTVSFGNVITREATHGRPITWTGEGFIEAHENTNISFVIDHLHTSGQYVIVIRYEMEDVSLNFV